MPSQRSGPVSADTLRLIDDLSASAVKLTVSCKGQVEVGVDRVVAVAQLELLDGRTADVTLLRAKYFEAPCMRTSALKWISVESALESPCLLCPTCGGG